MMANRDAARSDRTIPGPSGWPLLGNLLELRGDYFEVMVQWRQRYGDLLRFAAGPRVFYMVSHPELAAEILVTQKERFDKIHDPAKPLGINRVFGQGLVTSRGDLWRRQRSLLQPLFQKSRVMEFVPVITAVGEGLCQRWEARECGAPLDIGSEMMQATLEIIARTMFSTSMAGRTEALSPLLMTVMRFAAEEMGNPLIPPLWVPTPGNRRFRKALQGLDALVYGLIDQRRTSAESPGDLLDELLSARDGSTGANLERRQIRDEVMTVFVAGHETTAVALTWTCCLLARNPAVAERLFAEVDAALGGRAPGASDLPKLIYTRAVIEEAMRLYPPALGLLRVALDDLDLGGFRLPRGAVLFVNIANIQRHPEIWEAPDEFRPERFVDAASENPRQRLGYMPFGAGPRACLGSQFAMIEAVLLLASIANRFRLAWPEGQSLIPEVSLTLRPGGNPSLLLSRRH